MADQAPSGAPASLPAGAPPSLERRRWTRKFDRGWLLLVGAVVLRIQASPCWWFAHEVGFARGAARRIVLMEEGKIIEETTPRAALHCLQARAHQTFPEQDPGALTLFVIVRKGTL
jgi:hypothetical protein